MKVVGRRLWEVEVVYVADLRKVKPSACYVCRNQQKTLPLDFLQTTSTLIDASSINTSVHNDDATSLDKELMKGSHLH